ncbi:MAG: DUF4372 domain-containing protein [Alphaproteobacteria bacterium]|jgi:hypothetical protein|nr:DUF4372 domain-containing protein [Alphaproteobacteria bacterium]
MSMLYLHFSGVTFLRTLEHSLGSHHSSLYHLGKMHIKRPALSDVNQTNNSFDDVTVGKMILISSREFYVIDKAYIGEQISTSRVLILSRAQSKMRLFVA